MASLRFAGQWPPWLVVGGALVAAVAVAALYLRETRELDSPYSYLLPGLRASAVALVILILAGPIWHRRTVVGTLGRVVFAVDVSQSMSINDSDGSASRPTRLDRAMQMLGGTAGRTGWLESLSSTHEVDVLAFSEGPPSLVWTSRDDRQAGFLQVDQSPDRPFIAMDLAATGNRTDLSSSIEFLAASVGRSGNAGDRTSDDSTGSIDAPTIGPDPGQRVALVLMSDGRDNVGSSPMPWVESLSIAGSQVHSIGMGSQDEPSELALVRIDRPDSVAVDGRLAGTLFVEQFGLDGRDFTVRIESGEGEVVWQQSVKSIKPGVQSIPFELDVASIVEKVSGDTPRGVRRSTVVMDLRAVIEPIDGDTSTQNNAMPFRVAASTRDRRLLILDGSSRWETRYIRNLFDRDPAWSVDTVLFGPGTDMPRVVRGDQAGQFPGSREAISQYDAIVLGEVPPDQFEPTDAERIRHFVTRGGGLIVIDGQYERMQNVVEASLEDLVPVKFLDENELAISEIKPTRLGIDHPVLNLSGGSDPVADLWEKLPPPVSAVRVSAQEGAEVWADLLTTDGRRSPWLVTRLFGAGRVFYVSSDQTWRWRYKVADRFHARFWNQLLAAVMQPPYSANDDYVAIGTDKIEYAEGESALVRARLQDTSGNPVGDATVDALLIAENRIIATVPLSIDDPSRGTFQGSTGKIPPGRYDVRIRASGFDADALQATTPIWVGRNDSVEWNRVGLDENALAQVSDGGGGKYFHESSADQILDALRPLSSGSVVESDLPIWQTYYWFWAIMLLLATEWFLRKRAGLV